MPRPLPRKLLAALLLALSCAGIAAAAPSPAEVAKLADQVLQDIVASADFNGAVVLMRDGKVVYERGAGLAARNPDRPFTPHTPSDGASLAKTLTAATVWELVAEGRLKFDDPVTRHLPDYPYAQHTVRDLVTHRSGLPDYDYFDKDFPPGQVRDTADLLRVLAQRKPAPQLAPGVQVEYTNLGFDTAALVVERVTGQRIGALWRTRYFERLGLKTMFARPARFADWPGLRTPGYRRDAKGWQLNDAFDGEAFIGASNVHASAHDWARWGDAFASGGVMAPDRLDAGLRTPMFNSGLDNGLNLLSWYCDTGQQRCHYSGAYNGFYSQVVWDRKRREVVAFVSNSTLPAWRCTGLTRDLADALAGRSATASTASRRVPIARQDLARWAGAYSAAGIGPLTISAGPGRLFVRVGSGELASVFQVERDVFYAPILDLWLAFSGTPDKATLHVRSVFHEADAKREPAPAGKP